MAGLDQQTGICYEGEEGSQAGKQVDLMGVSMREEHNQRYDQMGVDCQGQNVTGLGPRSLLSFFL